MTDMEAARRGIIAAMSASGYHHGSIKAVEAVLLAEQDPGGYQYRIKIFKPGAAGALLGELAGGVPDAHDTQAANAVRWAERHSADYPTVVANNQPEAAQAALEAVVDAHEEQIARYHTALVLGRWLPAQIAGMLSILAAEIVLPFSPHVTYTAGGLAIMLWFLIVYTVTSARKVGGYRQARLVVNRSKRAVDRAREQLDQATIAAFHAAHTPTPKDTE